MKNILAALLLFVGLGAYAAPPPGGSNASCVGCTVNNPAFNGGSVTTAINAPGYTVKGVALPFGILYTSAGAPTAGGSGYVVGDTITLNGGTCATNPIVVATTVSATVITAFIVQNPGSCTLPAAQALAQSSTSGIGTGATFTVSWGPLGATVPGGTLTNGGGNFAIGGSGGEAAGFSLLNATENTFVGDKAGDRVTTGSFNTAMGHNAMGDGGGCNITGSNNTAYGTDALRNFCGNSAVTAIGSAALKNQTNSALNNITAIGASAGLNENNGNGSNNSTLVGNGAGSGQVGASYRQITAIGANAGANLTTANNDTLIGLNAGSSTLTNGTGNILIASGARTVDTIAAGSTGEINIEGAIIGYSAGNAPSIASGFAAAGSSISGTTFQMRVTVGATTPGSSGTVTMPTAPTGWDCTANDITTTSSSVFLTKQTGGSSTTVVLTNYNTSAAATAWAASDVLNVKCLAY